MANTYTLIASSTVGAGETSSIDFTSIPSIYTDLKVIASLRGTRTDIYTNTWIRFYGDSAGNYSYKQLEGDGSTVYSGNQPTLSRIDAISTGSTATSNTFGNLEFYIPNYLSSYQKSVSVDAVTENNGTTAYADMFAGKWTGTSAITQVSLVAATY
jgi:hypothetical protein